MTVGEMRPGSTFVHLGVEYTVVDHVAGRQPGAHLTRLTFFCPALRTTDEMTMNSDQPICRTPPTKSP